MRNEIIKKLHKYVDASYSLGDTSKGWDCLSILVDFYSDIIPAEFEGFTIANYSDKWSCGEGRDVLERFLFSLGEPINRNYALMGDLMIFRIVGENNDVFVLGAIYLGNATILCAFEKGVRVVPLKFFSDNLIGVRRCLK